MEKGISTSSFPQRGASIREQASGSRTTDPISMKKQFGDKSLKDILNEVADPNYKESKRKVKGVGNAELDKDAFFKLMLTQLKQQDPTNPLKSHEMAAQLAQFSSVEQLSNMNQTLTKMSQNGGEKGKFDVLELIGKTVSGDSGKIGRLKGDKEHKIEFMLEAPAEKAVIEIKDDKGILVKKYELKDLKKGKNKIIWNGLHADGKDARVGNYSASVNAQSRGRKVKVNTEFKGAVEGVQFTAKGPVLMVGGKTLSLRDVQKIEMSKAKAPMQSLDNAMRLDTKSSKGAKVENKPLANLDAAKMDKALRMKLEGKNKGIKPKL